MSPSHERDLQVFLHRYRVVSSTYVMATFRISREAAREVLKKIVDRNDNIKSVNRDRICLILSQRPNKYL